MAKKKVVKKKAIKKKKRDNTKLSGASQIMANDRERSRKRKDPVLVNLTNGATKTSTKISKYRTAKDSARKSIKSIAGVPARLKELNKQENYATSIAKAEVARSHDTKELKKRSDARRRKRVKSAIKSKLKKK